MDKETAFKLANKIREEVYKIEVEIMHGGYLPHKVRKTDAGFDLYATQDVEIQPGEIIKHPLNFRMKLPKGTWARIETKSGLGSKGMLVYAGVIDEEYRGIPHVIATNLNHKSDNTIMIKEGEKIAQLTINPHSPEYYIESVDKIDINTDRGEGGFGSTGV